MTPENFSAFLNSPEDKSVSIDKLQKLIEKYPYVQSLRIAYLKKLKIGNHPDFEKQVNQTATYVNDRNFLRKYINGENIYLLEYANNLVTAEALETLELLPLHSIEEGILLEDVELKSDKKEEYLFNEISKETDERFNLEKEVFVEEELVIEEVQIDDSIQEDELEETESNLVINEIESTKEDIVETNIEEEELVIEEVQIDDSIQESESEEIESNLVINEIESDKAEDLEVVESKVTESELELEKIEANETETEELDAIDTKDLGFEFIEDTEDLKVESINSEIIEDVATTLEEPKLNEEINTEIPEIEINDVIEEFPENETTVENVNENIDKMQQSIIEKKVLDNEIQHLIIGSKKVESHAPIEENIDHLLSEDELEDLDDEIEFGFEIDNKIIANEEDISLFEKKNSDAIKVEEQHDDEDIVESNHIADETIEIIPKEKVETDDFELSPDNIFSKDDLRQEGDLFFLDDKPTAEELLATEQVQQVPVTPAINFAKETSNYENEDAEAFPEEFEEEEAVEESRENVEQIKVVLSTKTDSKENKKIKIKAYLQRIAQIPLEEESLISETYAGLLAKQGKIERSIRMYQQLILKNPQKKVYFAAKIKQLIKSI